MIVDKSDILEDRRIKEFEWYLRDHLFRQSNQGRQQFKEESLAEEIISLYLRYRDSNLHNMNEIKNIVVEKLVHRQVIKRMENLQLFRLTKNYIIINGSYAVMKLILQG